MKKHTTFGPLATIEGHTPDGRFFTISAADVEVRPKFLFWGGDGEVTRCVLHLNTPDLVHDENGKMDLVYPSKTNPGSAPTGAIRTSMVKTHTALHEGRSPTSWWDDKPRVGGHLAKDALIIDAMSYVKATLDTPPLRLYRHPIELPENEKPTLAISKNQELWLKNQDSVLVTERGIEDMTSGIKRSGDSRPNPLTQENLQRAGVSSLMAGGAALGFAMGANYLLGMLPAAAQPYVTGYWGAGVRAVSGVVTAVLVDSVIPPEYRPVAAGIGAGGVVGGGMMAWDTYKASTTPAATPWPASFATAAAYDQWVLANPGPHTGTQPVRPPGGVAAPFGQRWSGQGQRRAA